MATLAEDRTFVEVVPLADRLSSPARVRRLAVGAALVLIVAGCTMERDTPQLPVTREQFGDAWPLTVPSGALSCEWRHEITIQWKGTEYTLTGGRGSAYLALDSIWAPTPDGARRKDLTPLIDRGRTLCE